MNKIHNSGINIFAVIPLCQFSERARAGDMCSAEHPILVNGHTTEIQLRTIKVVIFYTHSIALKGGNNVKQIGARQSLHVLRLLSRN